MSNRDSTFRLVFASVITTAWGVSVVVDLLVPAYDPPSGIHSLMLGVAAWAFGQPIVKSAKSRNGNNGGDSTNGS